MKERADLQRHRSEFDRGLCIARYNNVASIARMSRISLLPSACSDGQAVLGNQAVLNAAVCRTVVLEHSVVNTGLAAKDDDRELGLDAIAGQCQQTRYSRTASVYKLIQTSINENEDEF